MKQRCKSMRMRGRRGQALAEFIVCLVGIMFMFLGLMLIGALGAKNVESFMESREMADRNSDNVVASTDGSYITEWENGADGLKHTADDVKHTLAWSEALDVYREQLIVPAPTTGIVPEAHNEFLGVDGSGTPYLQLTEAAELTKGTGQTTLDLEDLGLDNALRRLLFPRLGSRITLTDETFMPSLILRGSDDG